tara:strand:- start:10560 stop:11627 length:1068 start_codon:yes stop_codon:yes gene_type:complete
MKGIILHGGHGTRLRPLTHTGPKQLLPIANKPMSQYCVESLLNAGINEIAFIVGGIGSKKVKEFYGNGERFDVKITYIEQDEPKGIAHAISLCEEFVKNEKFIVFLGDNFINTPITDFVKDFERSSYNVSLLLCHVENPEQFGIAFLDGDKISKVIEKPKNPDSNLAITGIYFLTNKIFEKIQKLKPSWRNEYEIVEALQMFIDENEKIPYNIISGFWKDTGTPNDIIHANKIILENLGTQFSDDKEKNVKSSEKISIGKNSIIKDDSQVIGPVIIGNNCIIEKNSIVGPNVSIGDNTKISNCRIQDSIIMSNCKINANISIIESIIAENSEINSEQSNKSKKKFLLGEGTKISL